MAWRGVASRSNHPCIDRAREPGRFTFTHLPFPLPHTHTQEFKEQEEQKRRRELEQAMGITPSAPSAAGAIGGGAPLSQQQQQQAAQEQAQGIADRFDQTYLKDRLLFGGIVSRILTGE